MKELRIGMIGYGFMGAAHSQGWRTAPRVFDLPAGIEMAVLVGRNAGPVAEAAPPAHNPIDLAFCRWNTQLLAQRDLVGNLVSWVASSPALTVQTWENRRDREMPAMKAVRSRTATSSSR